MRGVNSARGDRLLSWRSASGSIGFGVVHMEEKVQDRVQEEVGREEQRDKRDTRKGTRRGTEREQTLNRTTWMTMRTG